MNNSIKEELHELINSCDNEMLLHEAKTLLQSDTVKDWWDDLTEDDKEILVESEQQYEKGNFITHAQLMQQFEAWKNK